MDTLITALRAGRPEHTPEAEKVLVTVDGATVTLTLDDGEALHFDAAELAAALDPRWWAPRVYWPWEAAELAAALDPRWWAPRVYWPWEAA